MAEEIKITTQQLQSYFKAMKDELSQDQRDQLGGLSIEIETLKHMKETGASKSDIDALQKSVNQQLVEKNTQIQSLLDIVQKNQPIIDKFVSEEGKRTVRTDFNTKWQESMEKEVKGLSEDFQRNRDAKISMKFNLKDMTLSSVTGDTQQGYRSGPALAPAQRSNFRDLIPTTPSPTGSYVTYRETNTVQVPGIQTENQSKTDLNYAFTEVKTVSKYIAGKVDFSKHLMFALPFLMNTLPRMLLRDFYKKENDYFYITAAQAATGVNTISGSAVTVDAEELLQMIANQLTANFEASYAIVDWRQWARILATKPNDYSIPGGVVITPDGVVRFAGTPMVGASWAQTDHVLIFDRDIIERVETESLRVDFSYENNDNFEKNMVTARVECFEELNVLRPDGVIYRDFGNS